MSIFSNVDIDIGDLQLKSDIENFFKTNSSIITFRKVIVIKLFFAYFLTVVIQYLFSYFFNKDYWKNGYPGILATIVVLVLITALIGPKLILNSFTKSINSNDLLNFEYCNNTIYYIIDDRKFDLKKDNRITIISSSKLDSAILVFFAFTERYKVKYRLIMIPFDTFNTSLELQDFEKEIKQFEKNLFK